jgi:hypothetical protein
VPADRQAPIPPGRAGRRWRLGGKALILFVSRGPRKPEQDGEQRIEPHLGPQLPYNDIPACHPMTFEVIVPTGLEVAGGFDWQYLDRPALGARIVI